MAPLARLVRTHVEPNNGTVVPLLAAAVSAGAYLSTATMLSTAYLSIALPVDEAPTCTDVKFKSDCGFVGIDQGGCQAKVRRTTHMRHRTPASLLL